MAMRLCSTPMSISASRFAIEDGLLTPVIRAAQNKSLREISELAKELAHRARNKRMKPEEFQGGHIHRFKSWRHGHRHVLCRDQSAAGIHSRHRQDHESSAIDDCDQIVVGQCMSITMSCDHRVIDGALGAEYLKELRHLLENPALLLV
jgi:pyruvate dehydrogenase E2 component (dihydrolipoamide acetyltransferase)